LAKRIFKNAQIQIDSTDLSDFVTEVSVEDNRSEVDVSVVGNDNTQFLAGLRDSTVTITFLQDYDSGSVDSVLDPVFSNTGGKVVDVEILPDKDSPVSSTNPNYTMQSIGTTYNPVGGSVGEAQTTQVTFRPSGSQGGKLTRETS